MARYDVVKDYDWTSIPRGSGLRKKAPRVWVKSYTLSTNALMQKFKNYMEVLTLKDADAFYNDLYGEKVATPEDDFNFPFFSDSVRSFSNTFGDTFQNGFGEGGGIGSAFDSGARALMGTIAQAYGFVGTDAINEAGMFLKKGDLAGATKAVAGGIASGGNPGSYIENPKFYQYEMNDAPLDVSFILSNTINDDYDKNHKLLQRLTFINRPFRKNSIAMDPPRIYQVKVPGHRFIKWAYCSSFSSSLLGAKREMDGVIVPEAYQINMSFTSLTVEAANFQQKT